MPAAKRKSADRVAATRAIFLGLLGFVGVALVGLGIYFSSGGGHSDTPQLGTDFEIIENADRPRSKGRSKLQNSFHTAASTAKISTLNLNSGPPAQPMMFWLYAAPRLSRKLDTVGASLSRVRTRERPRGTP